MLGRSTPPTCPHSPPIEPATDEADPLSTPSSPSQHNPHIQPHTHSHRPAQRLPERNSGGLLQPPNVPYLLPVTSWPTAAHWTAYSGYGSQGFYPGLQSQPHSYSSSSGSSISSASSHHHIHTPGAHPPPHHPGMPYHAASSHPRKAKARADSMPLRMDDHDELNIQDGAGSTPLHWASMHGQMEKCVQLLEKGANVHVKNNAGYTPLHCASEFGNAKLVNMLIDHGADPSETNQNGHTSLHCAARWGHKQVLVMLIKHYDCDINAQDKNGWSPLHFAAFHGFDTLVRILCESGADFHLLTKIGEIPLHGASVNGHDKCVDILIRIGSLLDATDNRGRTPLHYAAYNGHEKTVRLLISHGASIHIKDPSGKTPLSIASKSCAAILADYEKSGATVPTKPKSHSEDYTILLSCHYDGAVKKTRFSTKSSFEDFSEMVKKLFDLDTPITIKYNDEDNHTTAHSTKGEHTQVPHHLSPFYLIEVKTREDYVILLDEIFTKRMKKLRIFIESAEDLHAFFCQYIPSSILPGSELHEISPFVGQALDMRLIRIPLNAGLSEVREILEARLKITVHSLYCRTGEYLLSVLSNQDWIDIAAELFKVARYHFAEHIDHALFPYESTPQPTSADKAVPLRGPHPTLIVVGDQTGQRDSQPKV